MGRNNVERGTDVRMRRAYGFFSEIPLLAPKGLPPLSHFPLLVP